MVVFVDVKIVSIPKLTDEWTWYKLTYVRQSTLFFVYGYIFIFIEYFEKSRVFFRQEIGRNSVKIQYKRWSEKF